MRGICDDLDAETQALREVVEGLTEDEWRLPTPADGWDTHETIIHLGMADVAASLAVLDATAFEEIKQKMLRGDGDLHSFDGVDVHALTGIELWEWFEGERNRMTGAFRDLGPKDRIPWFGPDMSALSFATARLMETWSHSHDVADTFGAEYPQTERLRHVAHIGITTRGWSYTNRGLELPQGPVRVELTSPSGVLWTWGPEECEDVVIADSYQFCLVVTQRRRPQEADLEIRGDLAAEWMEIAQAFAGPPTDAPEGRVGG
jgi:uncharacterized protein (TIGR03084 family)